ncbi:MAG: iron ABC transporter permease [Cytophagales bacterium]|nr:iron ABC transporter permease [Cytophagales bacterium]
MLNKSILLTLLGSLLVISFILSTGIGALTIYPSQILEMILVKLELMTNGNYQVNQETVFWSIRVPRVLAGGLVGAGLAISGACMQGLFRNPLADPGLIGISAGASLTASIFIVLGLNIGILGYYGLSVATFLGASFTTWIVYRLAQTNGKTLVSTMLLAGVAINALAGACTGFLTYLSDDAQLRSLTFWLLGSLGGANWKNVMALIPFVIIPVLFIPSLGKQLNAFALGENEAAYMGVNVSRLKVIVIILTTMAVGASVAIAGMIGFIGLVIPHILRLITGPNHKILLPASMLLGAIVLILSDLLSRTIFAPTELPIGIITSLLGTPLFLSILLKEKRKQTFEI